MGYTGFTLDELRRAVNPQGMPWTPNAPLPPVVPPGGAPIAWAPTAGYNLTYSPDKRPGVRHEQLRNVADACDAMRVVIEDLKRQLCAQKWDVTVKDQSKKKSKHPRQEEIRALLRKPDGMWAFTEWLGAAVEDLVVIGATALGKLRTQSGRPAGLRVIDAATIAPIVTSTGMPPDPPFPAYYQHLYGQPYREYTRDEMVYRVGVRRSWTPYGFGPVEQTLRMVLLAIHRPMYYIRWYTDSNIPPAFVQTPEGWNELKTKALQDYLDALMSGNTPQKHKALVVPAGTTVTPGRDELAWSYEFDEFIVRLFSWAVGVSPVYVVKNNTLGQGTEGLSQASEISGLAAYAKMIEDVLDDYIVNDLDCPELTFSWIKESPEDATLTLQKEMDALRSGSRTLNEIREDRGDEPYDVERYPTAAEPMVLTAAGYVPIEPQKAQPAPAPGGGGGQAEEQQILMAVKAANFDESEHPRGKTGPGTNEGSFAPASSGPALPNLAEDMAAATRENEGFTYDLIHAESPREGLSVAARPENEEIIPDTVTEAVLRDRLLTYFKKHEAEIRADNRLHFGGWWDKANGRIILDTPFVVHGLKEAVELAKKYRQEAIVNLATFETIKVVEGAIDERTKAKADAVYLPEEPDAGADGRPGDRGREEAEGEEGSGQEQVLKVELGKWRRKAMRDARDGRAFRPFHSEVIPEDMRQAIEARLASDRSEEAVRKAFDAQVERAEKPISGRITGSEEGKELLDEGIDLWGKVVEMIVASFAEQAFEAAQGAVAKAGDFDEQAHPREPAGAEEGGRGIGGRFAHKDGTAADSGGGSLGFQHKPLEGQGATQEMTEEYKKNMDAYMKKLGIKEKDIEAELEKLFERSRPEDAKWYSEALAWAKDMSAKYGIPYQQVVGAIAATSPQRLWDDNKLVVERMCMILSSNMQVTISERRANAYNRRNNRYVVTEKQARAYNAAHADEEGFKKLPESTKTYRGKKITPAVMEAGKQSESFVPMKAGTFSARDMDERHMAVLFRKENGTRMMNTTGVDPIMAGWKFLKGDGSNETADKLLKGPKTRSFYNNIMDPSDNRWATIDTWQLRAMFNNLMITAPDENGRVVTRLGKEWDNVTTYHISRKTAKAYNELHAQEIKDGSLKKLKAAVYRGDAISDIVKANGKMKPESMLAKIMLSGVSAKGGARKGGSIGLYPKFVEISQRLGLANKMLANEYQARVWNVLAVHENAKVQKQIENKLKREERQRLAASKPKRKKAKKGGA